jgi:hypothetical protein
MGIEIILTGFPVPFFPLPAENPVENEPDVHGPGGTRPREDPAKPPEPLRSTVPSDGEEKFRRFVVAATKQSGA